MAAASPPPSQPTADPSADQSQPQISAPHENSNPNPTPDPTIVNPNPSPSPSPSPAVVTPPPSAPLFTVSYRPLVAPAPVQYSAYPQPAPGVAPPPVQYPGAPPPPYVAIPNGYMSVTAPPPPGIPGIRYPPQYPPMPRPGFLMRPPTMMPGLSRPPITGIRPIPPVATPQVRPAVPIVTPPEKPQTTVYVGKIASSVDNDFMLSLLRLCGPVKSWKRVQDPSNGTLKGFGFCEFESAEGILRALRLISKLNIDGQELMLNINQATREYLDRYVEKKTEREKLKATEGEIAGKENESGPDATNQETSKPVSEENKKDADEKADQNDSQTFGIVTDEDRQADKEAFDKITNMIEERLKANPLPPPPPMRPPGDSSVKSSSEVPSKPKEGDSDIDAMKTDPIEDKTEDETISENKSAIECQKPEAGSPDRGRIQDRRSRERDREYESKREKERELERYERERERERVWRERGRELRLREAERLYKERLKEWEAREREKEYQRQKDRDRQKEKQRDRRREIAKQEDESDDDDDTRKRRRRGSAYEEKRRKRHREKEDDLEDRIKEEQEIEEAKKRAIEEQERADSMKAILDQESKDGQKVVTKDEEIQNTRESAMDYIPQIDNGDENNRNGAILEQASSPAVPDTKLNGSAAKKLGFGLVGSGRRTAVPSVFHQEEDDGVDEKKMRPLVPLDYSTEELQAVQVQTTASGSQPNLVAAAEYAKRILNANPKEEKRDTEKERHKRTSDRSSHKEREGSRVEVKDKAHDKVFSHRERDREDKPKSENKKLLDAKQLIDMIPRTKDELFNYEVNWEIYDKHQLHERMRPWISKKITEFLGEEEETLVEYIVTSTKDHVDAARMLDLLHSILDDEAEMFVLKMWRMLIFEIKKVETGLSSKLRA